MKLKTGDMLWTNINKIPNKYTYLSNNIECDVCIIGAGITGAIAAYYLTKEGVNTVLIDKNIVGYGSTAASTSIIQYEIDIDILGLKGFIGEQNAVQCFKLCEKAVYDIENIINNLEDKCDFSLKECFYYATKPSKLKTLEKEFNLRKQHGFNVEYLNKENAREKFSFNTEGGIYSKSGAAQIDPYRFTHTLIAESVKNGLTVYENTNVTQVSPNKDNVLLKTINNFNITAKKVIFATGYESKQYIDKQIVDLYRTFTIVTKPVRTFDGWHHTCIIRDNNDPYTYIRTTGDNRIIIGGEDEKVGGQTSKMSCLTNEDPTSIKKYNVLLQKIRNYFPKINDIDIEYKFSGLFGVTKDELPYIGEYHNMPHCYFSLGYGSNGIIYAMLGGQLLKDLYLGNHRPELNLFAFDR